MSLGSNLAKRLKELRGDKSQEWLASQAGLSRATINRWEGRGAGSATLDEVEEISKKLKIGPAILLGIADTPTKFHSNDVEDFINKTAQRTARFIEEKLLIEFDEKIKRIISIMRENPKYAEVAIRAVEAYVSENRARKKSDREVG